MGKHDLSWNEIKQEGLERVRSRPSSRDVREFVGKLLPINRESSREHCCGAPLLLCDAMDQESVMDIERGRHNQADSGTSKAHERVNILCESHHFIGANLLLFADFTPVSDEDILVHLANFHHVLLGD